MKWRVVLLRVITLSLECNVRQMSCWPKSYEIHLQPICLPKPVLTAFTVYINLIDFPILVRPLRPLIFFTDRSEPV
ncbi:hypothetical protein DL95DRAFT_66063 [Leptodontidium sp. 2 PMI_412]|nr:hypothetical protein DL95DRAFT_66063 [Leptodontidium sp. 2 PMI_412]